MNVLGSLEVGVGVPYQTLFAGLISLSSLSFLPLPSLLFLWMEMEIERIPPSKWAIASSMTDAHDTQKCSFVSSCLSMVATEQQNRGRHYQRHFCSKGKLLSNHYFRWSSFCFFGSVIIFLSSFLPASPRRPFKMCLLHRKQQRSLAGSRAWTWHCQATPSWVCIPPFPPPPMDQTSNETIIS